MPILLDLVPERILLDLAPEREAEDKSLRAELSDVDAGPADPRELSPLPASSPLAVGASPVGLPVAVWCVC